MSDLMLNQQFVLLDVARWFLCLPQSDVISVEMFNDVLCKRKGKTLEWTIKFKNLNIPVVGLNEQGGLQPLEEVESGMVSIIGNNQIGYIGLTSQDMDVVTGDFMETMTPVPRVMQSAEQLLDGVLFVDERLVGMTQARKLLSYIHALESGS